MIVKRGELIEPEDPRVGSMILWRRQWKQFVLPQEIVLGDRDFSTGIVPPSEILMGRAYYTSVKHDPPIVSDDGKAKTYSTTGYIIEVYRYCGDDGHTEVEMAGYTFWDHAVGMILGNERTGGCVPLDIDDESVYPGIKGEYGLGQVRLIKGYMEPVELR
jgi:hypothetical protein